MSRQAPSFEEFYAHYLDHHRDRTNRLLHIAGTLAAPLIVIAAVATENWWLLLAAPIVGYGCAWIGHFLFERNKPTAFHSPWLSFLADWRMVWESATGRLKQPQA